MARRDQMDRFMVGGERGPDPRNRPDPNRNRRPGDPYIIAQDSRPVGIEGLNKDEQRQYRDFLNASNLGFRGAKTPGMTDRQASKLGRMAFDQFRNLQSGGDYAPALRAGMTVPGGTIQRVPQEGGLAGFLGRGGFIGNFLGDIGGNAPRTIRPVDSGPSGRRARGSFNLNTGQTSAARKPTLSDDEIFNKLIKRATNVADAAIPTGGIMDNVVAPVQEAPVSVTTQPGGTIASPAPATTFAETGMDTPFLGPIAEGTGDFSTTQTADTVDNFEKLLAETLVAQAAAQSAARDTDQQLAAANTRALVADAVANQRATDAERAAALDAVNQAALEESRRQAALEALFTEAGLENMVGDGPMLELPPGTDPIDDFDMLTLGTTPMPPAESPYTPELEDIFTERDLGDMSYMRDIQKGVMEPALTDYMDELGLASMAGTTDTDGVGMYGRGRITSRVPLRVSPSYFGDLS